MIPPPPPHRKKTSGPWFHQRRGWKCLSLSLSLSTLTFYIIQIKWMNMEGINSQPVPERKSGRAQERNIDEQKKRPVCTAKSLRLAWKSFQRLQKQEEKSARATNSKANSRNWGTIRIKAAKLKQCRRTLCSKQQQHNTTAQHNGMEWNGKRKEGKAEANCPTASRRLLEASLQLHSFFRRRTNEFAGVQQQTLVMPAKLGKKRGPNSVLGVCVSEGKSDCVC